MKRIFIFLGFTVWALSLIYFYQSASTDGVPSDKNALNSGEVVQNELSAVAPQPYPYVIEPGSTFAAALRNLDITDQDIHQLVLASKPVRDLGRLQAGTRLQILFTEGDSPEFLGVRIRINPQESLLIQKNSAGKWTAEKIMKEIETRVVTFKGTVESSLWGSAVDANMNPALISELAEIFAWQVDFAREVKVGDRWRLSVEEEFVQGERIGWGSILSAEYVNGSEVHTAVLFRKDNEDIGYFAPDGSSLKRIFLKSPIQYGRISSRFQMKRFHPVLKIVRPHLGVDYAAPTGTPVRVVGDGIVEAIGKNSGAGNFIKIRHNGTYSTAYKHLSRFAKGLKRGSSVQQGKIIGYVGSTGLSSGPHLHFEFYMGGRYVDPLGRKFPAASPVPQNQLTDFVTAKKTFLAYLPIWER
ncbi:MAG: peptidoglycan DD-metalloendopeptidase family protein [Pseudobdellovibrionaceae bacterium]